MENGRLIAIGDIHGKIDKLDTLLKNIKLQKNDTLVFLGDYIDRGKYSKDVVERLINLSKAINCVFLKGNHEQMLLKIIKTKSENDINFWLINGGYETMNSYIKSLKPYYLTDKYLFVHAGINPDKATIEEQTDDDLLWIRDKFIDNKHSLKQKIIFGHTAFYEPHIEDDKIGIDTGCGKEPNSPLTAFICDEEVFVQSDMV